MIDHAFLQAEAAEHAYPLLFATVSGAHLYGFPSHDSDYDLRGVHVLPRNEVLGLFPQKQTIELSTVRNGIEIDHVTHDALKFFRLLLKPNGYILEQLYSPLIVVTRPEHEELKRIARKCITRHHVHHYLGFAANQWSLFSKESPPRVKPLLYVFRVLLTGIHLMKTGEVEANLPRLNEAAKLPYLPDLIARKTSGSEHARLSDAEKEFHRQQFETLRTHLEEAGRQSHLQEAGNAQDELNSLLLKLRCSFG